MVLGKLSVPGRPTNMDNSRTRPTFAVGASGDCMDIFSLVYHFPLHCPFNGPPWSSG